MEPKCATRASIPRLGRHGGLPLQTPLCYFGPMFSSRTRWDTSPNRLAACLEKRRRQGLPILDLTESNPTHCGFAYDPEPILQGLAGEASLRYEPDPRGLAVAREAVANYYADRRAPISSDRIILTTGTSEAYSFLFRLLADSGDEILAPAPSYPLLDFLAELNDVNLITYPLLYENGWRIDLEKLAAAINPRSRAIVVVTPNNPTGSFLRRGEIQRLIELARDHGLALIADEVFRDYAWAPESSQPDSLATVEDCLTFTLSGLSKIAALPQMKLAWIVTNGPSRLVEDALRRLEVIADTYLSVSTPVQQAAASLMAQGNRLRPQLLERIHENLTFLDRSLTRRCRRLEAEGGWYAILQVPGIADDEDWAVRLLEEKGVYVHPGQFFGFSQEGHLVVSLITPGEIFRKGTDLLLAHL